MDQNTRNTAAAITNAVMDQLRKLPKEKRRDKMLTGKEAAALAGVHRATLRAWEHRGFIHPVHVTRKRIRFSRNELEDFLCETAEA